MGRREYDLGRTRRAEYRHPGQKKRVTWSPSGKTSWNCVNLRSVLLNGAVLGPHLIHEKIEGFGADDLGELALVVVQDADPVHDDIVENIPGALLVHEVFHRDGFVGAH